LEAENLHGVEFGVERLTQACMRRPVTPRLLIDEACRFASPVPATGDATALLIQRSDAAG
jgi:hypothetical protein